MYGIYDRLNDAWVSKGGLWTCSADRIQQFNVREEAENYLRLMDYTAGLYVVIIGEEGDLL